MCKFLNFQTGIENRLETRLAYVVENIGCITSKKTWFLHLFSGKQNFKTILTVSNSMISKV